MPSSSGADTKPGSAKYREHSHGRQDREYTSDQKAAVERINKCKVSAYYEILNITKEASEAQIKKAYHKLSLQTHPDKNGAPGADEAFKLVSKAFQVLSDPQKRTIFDQTGADPESRGAGGAPPGGDTGGHPFTGFGGMGGPAFQAEISPEDLFNMFFGAGGGGMGMGFGDRGGFATFGGPGIRVHQFGGAGPRMRRPGHQQTPGQRPAANEPVNLTKIFWQLLPLIIFFLLPMLSSLLPDDTPRGPTFDMDFNPPFTELRHTPDYKIPYWANPAETSGLSRRDLTKFEKHAQSVIIKTWNYGCKQEQVTRQEEIERSRGVFWTDTERLNKAKRMKMPNCRKLEEIGIRPRTSQY